MYQVFFEKLNFPACIIDHAGIVRAWNPAMAVLTQVPTASAVGHPLRELGDLSEKLHAIWDQNKVGQQPITFVDVTFSFSSVELPETGWALLLEHQNASSDLQKNQMLHTVSHDLRAPLSAIKGYWQLVMAHGDLNEKQTHYGKRIELAVEEMNDLITQLLDVAWIDSGMPLKRVAVDLALIIQNTAKLYEIRADAQNVSFKLDVEGASKVLADEYRIKQVVGNLISNAIKYSPDGGEVEIFLQDHDEHVRFLIQDHGMGIAPEYLERIFERFFRVPGMEAHRIDGSGLGLAICYEIIQMHGAELIIASKPGEGSSFSFTLPQA